MNFIHKIHLAPSKQIKLDKWNHFHFHSQDLLSIFYLIYFFEYETIPRRNVRCLVVQIQIQAVWITLF